MSIHEQARAACPHCPDGHAQPESRPWGVFVASEVDGDGQPTHLYVAPTAGQHVAESDAEWARARLNEAATRTRVISTEDIAAAIEQAIPAVKVPGFRFRYAMDAAERVMALYDPEETR